MSNQPNISARIVADSVNPAGVRITSWILRYPRFIHSEFMTHRCFSRNAASSRAIPFKKMRDDLCAHPERWAAEQKGMQGGEALEPIKAEAVNSCWFHAMDNAKLYAGMMSTAGVHKSIANRLLEPFAHMTVLATATDHQNFFALRAHPDAQPEFQVLAYRMLDLYLKNEPRKSEWGWWHVPNFGCSDLSARSIEDSIKIATARCARLSYLTFDGEHSPAKDLELHDRLLASGHLSPFEHCAQAVDSGYKPSNFDFLQAGDFKTTYSDTQQTQFVKLAGWLQYRKTIKGENKRADLQEVMARKPEWVTLP